MNHSCFVKRKKTEKVPNYIFVEMAPIRLNVFAKAEVYCRVNSANWLCNGEKDDIHASVRGLVDVRPRLTASSLWTFQLSLTPKKIAT